MSLEHAITTIMEMLRLTEGMGQAKRLYVDTKKMTMRQLKLLAAKDPTPQKKYVEWMAKMYVGTNDQRPQRNTRQYDIIAEFDGLLSHIEQRDIYQYQNLEAVGDAVSTALREIAAEKEAKKEEEVRKALIEYDGSVQRVMRLRKSLIRDYDMDEDYIMSIKQKMEDEQAGIFGKDFTIDTKIFKEIDPNDVVKSSSSSVVIVKPLTMEKSQLYGRYPPDWSEAKGANSLGSPWCTSYVRGHNRFSSYYQNGGDTFYIILPKTVDIVPEKKYAKMNIQIPHARNPDGKKRLTAWDFEDHSMSGDDIRRVLSAWDIDIDQENADIG